MNENKNYTRLHGASRRALCSFETLSQPKRSARAAVREDLWLPGGSPERKRRIAKMVQHDGSFKVKNLCFSNHPTWAKSPKECHFIFQNSQWVAGAFAQNFICSPRSEESSKRSAIHSFSSPKQSLVHRNTFSAKAYR